MTEDNIQLPDYVCFKPSKAKPGHNGLFTTRELEANEPLGIYRGKVRRILPQTADEEYVWAVLSARGLPVFYIDASNPNDGNYLRFIRWTHEKSQQNVMCMQQNQQIHYFSMRKIELDEELLTYIERQKSKKKEKRENGRTRRETRQQQSTQHQDNPAIKILELEPGSEFIDDDNVHLVMNNRSLEFELQITRKFLSETLVSDGVKQTCLKCDICHQIFMSNVAFKFHYHTYHITPQYLSPANRPRTKVRDHCNICRYSFIANDVKSVMVDLLEIVSGGERLQENRYVRLHIYRCHWCAPIDAHYNTAKQLSQHVRSKHYRLLQTLLATQANMLQNNGHATRGKRSRENEQDENNLNVNGSLYSGSDRQRNRQSNVLQSHLNYDSSMRLPIPIGLPDALTDRDCQHLHTIGEQIAYNSSHCIDGTLEDLQQNDALCQEQMQDDDQNNVSTSIEHFLNQYPLTKDLLGPRRRHDTVIQHLSDDYFDHPKNSNIDMSKYYQRQKSIPERRFIMNRYLCILCSERFGSPTDLIEHEKTEHKKNVSVYDWGWNSTGLLQSNPYGFILELESELKQQQQRTKTEPSSFLMNNNNIRRKAIRQRSTSSNDQHSENESEDEKPDPPKSTTKRVKKEFLRSNTFPTPENNRSEPEENKTVQRKSNRIRRSNRRSPSPKSPKQSKETTEPKKEPTRMKRPSSVSNHKENQQDQDQVIVKTDKRHYWCTKCSTVYSSLISLYTESHHVQCVGENQRFNVVEDLQFFNDEQILKKLPSNLSSEQEKSSSNSETENSRRKESIFFSKSSDESRTYLINGKTIRMNSLNRPVTVKDLRQQFNQQASTTNSNPSEEYVFQQQTTRPSRSIQIRSSQTKNNDASKKLLPQPRSLDRFGISSDEDEESIDEKPKIKIESKPTKAELEKTLIKRRFDPDFTSTSSTGHDGYEARSSNKQIFSRKSQPIGKERSQTSTNQSLKRSYSQTNSVRRPWKQEPEFDGDSSESMTSINERSTVPEALRHYDYICSKCNMPFVSQLALDEHQNGQCLEMNVLAPCGSWFRCPLCSLTYCDATLMSLHINKTHRDVLRNNQRAHAQRRSNSRH